MKTDIHPESRLVIFKDITADVMFLAPSTVKTTSTGTYEGQEYPLYEIEISSASHPFWTGNDRSVDTAGRVERFKARLAKTGEKKPAKKA